MLGTGISTADVGYPVLLGIMIFWGIIAVFGIVTTILNGKVSESWKKFTSKKPKRVYK